MSRMIDTQQTYAAHTQTLTHTHTHTHNRIYRMVPITRSICMLFIIMCKRPSITHIILQSQLTYTQKLKSGFILYAQMEKPLQKNYHKWLFRHSQTVTCLAICLELAYCAISDVVNYKGGLPTNNLRLYDFSFRSSMAKNSCRDVLPLPRGI